MGRGRIANKIFLFNSADVPEVSRPKFQDLISKILNGVSAGLCYILHMFVFFLLLVVFFADEVADISLGFV